MASLWETPPALYTFMVPHSQMLQNTSGTLLMWVVLWISVVWSPHQCLFLTVAAFAVPYCRVWIQCAIYFINQGSNLPSAREFSYSNGWQMDTSRQKNTRKQLCAGARSDGQWSQPNSWLAGSRRRATCLLLYLEGQGLLSQKKLSLPPALQSFTWERTPQGCSSLCLSDKQRQQSFDHQTLSFSNNRDGKTAVLLGQCLLWRGGCDEIAIWFVN